MKKGLESFSAYRKSLELFDFVAKDMEILKPNFTLGRLISQQLASADSIRSNLEEGYGRLSRKEYVRFLDFARASARETQGRYKRLRHWLGEEVVQSRVLLLDEILAILTATIITLRKDRAEKAPSRNRLKEDPEEYGPQEFCTRT